MSNSKIMPGYLETGVKHCPACNFIKEVAAFYPVVKHGKTYRSSWCRECQTRSFSERIKASSEEFGALWAQQILAMARYKAKLGGYAPPDITAEEVSKSRKNAVCAIDRRHADKLHLDHDHATGFVRGWLCCQCNLNHVPAVEALGLAGIDRVKAYLASAAKGETWLFGN